MVGFGASHTLNEEQVAHIIGAVVMAIARLSALVTNTDHFVADALAQTLIKDKILSDESIVQAFLLHFPSVVDDAPI